MKTTVEISDALLNKARRYAGREGITLKAVIEMGLRKVVAEKAERQAFKLRPVSFKGQGLQAPMQGAGWEATRAAIYEGRGEP